MRHKQPDADPFDLLCHVAFNAPLRTRRERAQRLRTESKDFFDQFAPEAREVLDELLEKYTEHGAAQFRPARRARSAADLRHGNVDRDRCAVRRPRASFAAAVNRIADAALCRLKAK